MGTMTFAPAPAQKAPGRPSPVTQGLAGRWLARLGRVCRRAEVWYAGFALYATGVVLFAGPGLDRDWGIWASCGYGAAAAVAWCWPSRHGKAAALAVAVAGALAGPAAWLAVCLPATPDISVVSRAGVLLLQHGSPYLAGAQLAHGGYLAYNPYLPVMTVFGLPHALGLPGLAGDPRPWLAAVTAGLLVAAFRIGGRPHGAAWAAAAFLVATPALALPLALGVTDGPIIALIILTMALAARRGRSVWLAAVVVGTACAMKYTAWPALAVLVAMVTARDGARAAARFATAALATAAALVVALTPAVFTGRAGLTALAANTIGYPLGLTRTRSPAQSPLPGHLLATLGPAGHAGALALLIAAGLGIAAWVLVRPPVTVTAATHRVAVGLTLLFLFSPDTRFGYFAYPLALYGWLGLTILTARIRQVRGDDLWWPGVAFAPSSVLAVPPVTSALPDEVHGDAGNPYRGDGEWYSGADNASHRGHFLSLVRHSGVQ